MVIDPQQQDPTQLILALIAKTAHREDLNLDVQANAIYTLTQAYKTLTEKQQEQIPAQAQFELEVKKFQMDHELRQLELMHRIQLEREKQQADLQIKEMQAQHNQQMKAAETAARIKQQQQQKSQQAVKQQKGTAQ